MNKKLFATLALSSLATFSMASPNTPDLQNEIAKNLNSAQSEWAPGARWWWLGSAVNKADIKWNMEQYAAKGIGTLEITPLYGVKGNDANNIEYLSPKWMEMLKYVEEEGQRLGIEIDMNNGTGWPFGGPTTPLEEAACKAVIVDTVVSRKDFEKGKIQYAIPEKEKKYATFGFAQAFPTDKRSMVRVIALYVGRTRQQVKRAAPGGQGYVIDHFDRDAVKHYLEKFDKAFNESGTPWPHTIFNDSYEVYGADWTPTLPEEFQKRRGYSLQENINKLVDGDPQVVSDYRETLSDMLLENFTQQWVAWAHQHGMKVRNQAHGSPANLLDLYAAVDIPEIEGFGLSEFGIKGLRVDPGMTKLNDSDYSMFKYAPSAAHVSGKNLVSSETFTWLTEHFRTSLSQMKPDLDLMFCAGVNHMFYHGICYSPKDDQWPGWKFYASVDMSPTNSIWRDAEFFNKYITRCQSLLQWGKPDNDVLVYFPVRNLWKDNTKTLLMQFAIHNLGELAPEFKNSILELNAMGYDCDYISDRQILAAKAQAKAGSKYRAITTGAGARYNALLIPAGAILSDTLQQHIEALKADGIKVINGNDPIALKEVATAEEMKTKLGLNIIRRRNEYGHHYFIANLTPKDVDADIALAVKFQDAKWYDPMTDKWFAAVVNDDKVNVSLRSGESMFLMAFNDTQEDSEFINNTPVGKTSTVYAPTGTGSRTIVRENINGNYVITQYIQPDIVTPRPTKILEGTEVALTNKWNLSFIEEAPAVGKAFTLDKPQTWESISPETAVTMGTGVYETTFNIDYFNLTRGPWQIDLGDVRESARVYINDVFVGCSWSVPYLLTFNGDILKSGNNTLRIEVTNLPANRIADLDRKGVEWRKFEEINVVDIKYKKTKYDNWAPVPSGLNTPVRIYALQ